MAPRFQAVPNPGSPKAQAKETTKASSKGSGKSSKNSDSTKRSRSGKPKPLPLLSSGQEQALPERNYSYNDQFFIGQLPYSSEKTASIVGTTVIRERGGYALGEYEAVGEGQYARKRRRLCSIRGILFLLGNAVFVAIPFVFLVLLILASRLDGQRVEDNDYASGVHTALQICTTIFPFAFAAITGRTMKAYARHSLQLGRRVGTVESLLGSQTLWQTFKTQFLLRRLSLLTLPLLFLWALSPIGSQGSFRVLGTEFTDFALSSSSALVLPTGGMSEAQFNSSVFFNGPSLDQRNAFLTVDSLYTAALLSPNKNTARDIWGNVKIPWVNISGSDWVSTTNRTNDPANIDSYTSLVGIPVANIPSSGSANLTLDSAHFILECPTTVFNASYSDTWWKNTLGQIWGASKKKTDDLFFNTSTASQTNFFLDTNGDFFSTAYLYKNKTDLGGLDANGAPQEMRNILFGTRIPVSGAQAANIAIRNCTVQLEYVESAVSCKDGSCQVDKVRKSPRYADFNTYASPLDSQEVALGILKGLPYATGAATFDGESPSGLFIRGSNSPIIVPRLGLDTNPNIELPDVLTLSSDLFATRLATLLNTYYQLSLAPTAYLGNLPTLDTGIYGSCQPGSPCSSPNPNAPFFAFDTSLNNLAPGEVYVCNYTWLGITAGCAFVLLLVAALGIRELLRCDVPDVLGYVSTIIGPTGTLTLPQEKGPLDGIERARWMDDTSIKIADSRIPNRYPREAGNLVEY